MEEEQGQRWIVVHTADYAMEAHGFWPSEIEAIEALWQDVQESGYQPGPGETAAAHYLEMDDVWVVRLHVVN